MKLILSLLLTVFALFAVDINHANAKELSSLKGIGLKKAKAIISYRKKHGCFPNIEALSNVKRIGKKTIAKNRANLEAKKCKK